MPSNDELTPLFHAMRDWMTPDDALLARLDAALAATPPDAPVVPTPSVPPRRLPFGAGLAAGGLLGVAVAAALVLGVFAPVGTAPQTWAPVVTAGPASPAHRTLDTPALPYVPLYAAVSAAVHTFGGSMAYGGASALSSPVLWTTRDAAVTNGAPVPASANGGALTGGTAESGFTGTNVQVDGIDEGDIVKTDGTYLYIAKGRTVSIVAAGGADTRHVATIDVSELVTGDEILVGPVSDLMIAGTTLVVLTHGFEADTSHWSAANSTYVGLQASHLKAVFYDITDPGHPTYLSQTEQSGSYVDSRLSGGVLYLVSNYWVDGAAIDAGNPATFVPTVRDAAGPAIVAPGDVFVGPGVAEPAYALVTAIDVARRAVTSEQAVLGSMPTVYMSASNLYLAATRWSGGVVAAGGPVPLPAGVAATDGTTTDIVRIALNNGTVSLAASGSVPGSLINQFALDERDGYLRTATTWTDTTNGTYQQNSGLWVLDPTLTIVGSIPVLAENEAVQSVRFDGPVGYVVTFRQRDPLFTVDLTDPAAPTVQGALKIPGFSQYLHPFGDGLLLGVGVDADETGAQTGLKLSMFDVHDPFDVREAAITPITGDMTPVAADHKAAFIDVDSGLAGFATLRWENSLTPNGSGYFESVLAITYHVFSWTGSEFQEVAAIPLPAGADSWKDGSAVRGLRIGGDFYLVTDTTVTAYDMAGYAPLATVALA